MPLDLRGQGFRHAQRGGCSYRLLHGGEMTADDPGQFSLESALFEMSSNGTVALCLP
jgi:hypothetical protein